MSFATIAAAIAYVESFATRPADSHDALPPTERQAARFPQMFALLQLLDNPQERVPVAHITGTSGKGSTATMLAAIAQAAGKHMGLYTNPYITCPQERIQIDGAYIADAEFMTCAATVADAVARLTTQMPLYRPHIKEIYTALALLAFARAHVDLAVVEVGMGGRYDETNVVHPIVTVITNVGFDHMEFLGSSLAAIAWHKAGIIKAGAPVITGVTQPEVQAIVHAEAALTGANVATLGVDFTASQVVTSRDGTHFTYQDHNSTITAIALALSGDHQATNAALAIRAAYHLLPTLNEATIRAGLAHAWLPGRFEIVARHPLIILDAAHNPDKMHALATTMRQINTTQRVWIIFGALSTKESTPMLAALTMLAPQAIITTTPTVAGRLASPAARIAQQAQAQGMATVVEPDPWRAVDYALTQAAPDDIIIITGSLFLVSQVRGRWRAASPTT